MGLGFFGLWADDVWAQLWPNAQGIIRKMDWNKNLLKKCFIRIFLTKSDLFCLLLLPIYIKMCVYLNSKLNCKHTLNHCTYDILIKWPVYFELRQLSIYGSTNSKFFLCWQAAWKLSREGTAGTAGNRGLPTDRLLLIKI